MIRWLCGHISPTASSQGRYSRWRDRRPVRPDGNNVGGPSHATYRDCTTASQSNSPNYKIIILRLAPPGNTRNQTGISLSLSLSLSALLSRPRSPCSPRTRFSLFFLPLLSSSPFSSVCRLSIRLSRRSPLIRVRDAAHVCRERSLRSFRTIGIILNWLTFPPYLVFLCNVLYLSFWTDNFVITLPVIISPWFGIQAKRAELLCPVAGYCYLIGSWQATFVYEKQCWCFLKNLILTISRYGGWYVTN